MKKKLIDLIVEQNNIDAKTASALIMAGKVLVDEQKITKNSDFDKKERKLKEKETDINQLQDKWQKELERISGLSSEEAKQILIKELEDQAKHDARHIISKIEDEANRTASKKARDVLVKAMQRIASEVTSDVTIASVPLPSDEMKGRIIGREGRNIRALETMTGVDIIIDDTPEAVVISCFDPVRREIAKIALTRLVTDGRIHPTRIEEVVGKVISEVNEIIFDEGEKSVMTLGVHGLPPEGIINLGRLYFRTSYGQNVLYHSMEVAKISGVLAAEIGADVQMAKRAGLLHDLGKGAMTDGESSHTEAGYEMAKKMGEPEPVLNAIMSHHGDIEPNCIESIIVQMADAISASRPGARRESIEGYVKRLENLEKIAESYDGVEKAFAIQAGREIRVVVNNEEMDDVKASESARSIAKQIESELKYPGKIKVTVIRETRFSEYAR